MSVIKKANNILDNIFDTLTTVVSSVFILVVTGLVFVEVISRYVFGKSFSQISEYSIFLFVWMVFLMMGKVLKEKRHISIALLPDYLESKRMWRSKGIVNIYINTTIVLFSVVYLYLGILDTIVYYRVGYHSTLDYVPFYWIWHLAFPIGLFVLLFYSVRGLISSIKEISKGRES
ncbi:MAG TPA: TRAP transporter small permease subunit [Syntrophales bacterium]|nr:TRAP transporter small permease subunit [Syntrophales bacterium]